MATSDTRTAVRAVRLALGRSIFVPATTRLLWVPVHLLVLSLAVVVTRWWAAQGLSPFLLAPLSVLVGMSFAGLAFVAHETLHGALTHDRTLRRIVGFVGFSPFGVSPTLWVAWHNSVHHSNTNIPGRDPDAYPTLEEYRASRTTRIAVDWAAPRAGSLRGWFTLAFGFSIQSLQVLLSARKKGYLSPKGVAIAWVETMLSVCLWASLLAFVGLQSFLLVYVFPLILANAIVMAHIITNHSLCPLCEKNDAIASGLTVSVPKWFEFYSLGFGYHVEHHLFPAMSNRYAPLVQAQLRKLVPERYQEMPLTRALHLMFTTPRVYATPTTLVDPKTRQIFETLGLPEPPEPEQSRGERAPVDLVEPPHDEPSKVRTLAPVLPLVERSSTIPPPNAA